VNSLPILATAHFYTGKRRDQFRFYFGAGVGTYYIMQRLEIVGGGDDNTYAYWGLNVGFVWQSF